MTVHNNILSNHSYLKQINRNFDYFIHLIHSNYTPLSLSSDDQLLTIEKISLEFLQEFIGSNNNHQIQLLSNIKCLHQLWTFLSVNAVSYESQNFLEELSRLTSKFLCIKQHLSFHVEHFLLTLSVSHDDNLRFGCFKILSLLINDCNMKLSHFNRICYEYLYDFDIYYDQIRSLTIESRIIPLTKENLTDLINGQIIRRDLEEKILEAIVELGGYVFFKMRRSPKDAYQNLCKEMAGDWSDKWALKPDEEPQKYFMRIRNIDQLKLLLKSSDRLQEDLKEDPSNGKLILRKWIDHIPNEYRCFVCHGKLNAVSAYQSIDNEKEMKDFLNSTTFENIILSIPYTHAVVDCSIDPTDYRVLIIEINPFSKRSSSAKFSWVIDRDILYSHYDIHGFVNVRQ